MGRWLVVLCLLAGCSPGREVEQGARLAALEAQLQEVRGKLVAAYADVDGLKAAVENLDGVPGGRSAERYDALAKAVDDVDVALQDAMSAVEEDVPTSATLLKTSRMPGIRASGHKPPPTY